MNIIHKLTLKQLCSNKKRTIVTIIGIIISVSMFTAVTTFVTSFMKMMQLEVASYDGSWHVSYDHLDSSLLPDITSNKNIQSSILLQSIDTLLIDETAPSFATLDQIDNYPDNLKLLKGNYPTNSNEIIISKYYQFNNDKIQIGDEITVKADAEELADQYKQTNQIELSPNLKTKTFKVVGIYEPNFLSAKGYYESFYTANSNEVTSNKLYLTLKDVDKTIYSKSSESAQELGISTSDIAYHQNLLYYYGISNNSDFNQAMYSVIGIVMIIIMIGSIGLIYNAFAISLNERSKALGTLSSIGATKAQKRQSVYFEGIIVGSIAIGLGVIAGIVGMAITFNVINPILENLGQEIGFPLTISFKGILAAIIFAIITIFISSIIPARHASKISPIAAINNQQDNKIKKRSVKTSFITKKLFGFEGDLAMKNIKRNKNRYRVTLMSLIISSILFLTASGFTYYLKESYDITAANTNFDGAVYPNSDNQELINELSNLKNVDQLAITKQAYLYLDTDISNINPELLSFIQENGVETDKNYFLDINLISYDQVYLNSISDLNKQLKQHILVNQTNNIKLNRKYMQSSILKTNTTALNGTTINQDGDRLEISFNNLSYSDDFLLGQTPFESYNSLYFLVNSNTFDQLCSQYQISDQTVIYYTSNDNDAVVKEIKEITDKYPEESPSSYNLSQESKQISQTILIINIFTYGFIILIGLISIANIINTISTSMALRTKEFSMLKSIGMTPKAFNKMIYFESLFYGIKTLIYSFPIGLAIMYCLYLNLTEVFNRPFTVPIISFIILTIVVFMIVFTTLAFSSQKIKKLTIIDGLKNDNI